MAGDSDGSILRLLSECVGMAWKPIDQMTVQDIDQEIAAIQDKKAYLDKVKKLQELRAAIDKP